MNPPSSTHTLHTVYRPALLLGVLGLLAVTGILIVRQRERGRCFRQMLEVFEAKSSVGTALGLSEGETVPASEIAKYMRSGKIPQCPSGEAYAIGSLGVGIVCPIHGDLLRAKFGPDYGRQGIWFPEDAPSGETNSATDE